MALSGLCRRIILRPCKAGIAVMNKARYDGKILGYIIGDGKRSQRSAGNQQLLANLHNLYQLGRVIVQVDHITGFFGCLGTRVHRYANIGLSQSGEHRWYRHPSWQPVFPGPARL